MRSPTDARLPALLPKITIVAAAFGILSGCVSLAWLTWQGGRAAYGGATFVVSPAASSAIVLLGGLACWNATRLKSADAERRRAEAALSEVKLLQGILPLCSYCKKIRDDRNYWQQVEHYIAERSEAEFSHGICPDCYEEVVRPQLHAVKGRTSVLS